MGCWPQEDSSPQGSLGPAPQVTLMREYHAVLAELEVWRERKAQRMLQYERLQARPCFPSNWWCLADEDSPGPQVFACQSMLFAALHVLTSVAPTDQCLQSKHHLRPTPAFQYAS